MSFEPYFGTAAPYFGASVSPFAQSPSLDVFQKQPTSNFLQIGTSRANDEMFENELNALVSKYKMVERPSAPKLNVSTISVLLTGYKTLLSSIDRIWKYLDVTKKTLGEDDWKTKCNELNQKRELLEEIEKQLDDPYFKALIQRTVKRAKAKRERIKRRNIEWRAKKNEIRANRQEKHKKIDLWLDKMKDEVERARRTEMVKNEADAVLSGVTQKKTEAKRILGLLNSLSKLRNAKLTQLASSNKRVSEEETKSFNLVIDKLKNMWAVQLKEYNLEEQGLRVMLTDAEVERINTEVQTRRRILNLWTETLFGSKKLFDPLQAQPSDFDQFVNVRKEWDRFISCEDSALASHIPTGWVVPVKPSNSDWAAHCSSKNHITM